MEETTTEVANGETKSVQPRRIAVSAEEPATEAPVVKRRPGRPKGSKNKTAKKTRVVTKVSVAGVKKRGPGRPKGTAKKVQKKQRKRWAGLKARTAAPVAAVAALPAETGLPDPSTLPIDYLIRCVEHLRSVEEKIKTVVSHK